jgi:hypothetical protein
VQPGFNETRILAPPDRIRREVLYRSYVPRQDRPESCNTTEIHVFGACEKLQTRQIATKTTEIQTIAEALQSDAIRALLCVHVVMFCISVALQLDVFVISHAPKTYR